MEKTNFMLLLKLGTLLLVFCEVTAPFSNVTYSGIHRYVLLRLVTEALQNPSLSSKRSKATIEQLNYESVVNWVL
jgi:hypothetical protein